MRYREVPDETMLQAIISLLSGQPKPKPKIVTWYQRWVKFIRTKPSGPFWHEHPER